MKCKGINDPKLRGMPEVRRAARAGIPIVIIVHRINNGWPIHLLHAKTIDERGMS